MEPIFNVDEIFNGSAEDDLVFGNGTGNTLNGAAGDDQLFGDGTNNQLFGDEGNDQLFSNGTSNILNGGVGDDEIFGNGTNSQLFGDDGNDDLYSNGSDNTLNGGTGNDRLFGSGENIRLFGNEDADLFGLSVDNNLDTQDNISTIEDFQDDLDQLRLPQNAANSFIPFEELTIVQQGENTEIRFNDDRLAILTGIEASQITADDFIETDTDFNTNNNLLQLTGGTAQIAYVAYYGRPADFGGRSFWNQTLTEQEVSYAPRRGDSLTGSEQEVYEEIVNAFGTSEEADLLFGGLDSNRDKIDLVYQFAFDRNAEVAGLDYWEGQIDLGHVTLVDFALEVGLGAQNGDIVVLSNKIESADLFSNSLDTEAEINAYTGSSGANFGRQWLDDFGDVVSSQAQVDSALTALVDG